jgi:Na+-driven multidrug efflux pump
MATGAGRRDLIPGYVGQACLVAAAVVAVPAFLVTWRPALWIGLFSAAPEVERIGTAYFHRMGPTYVFVVASMVIGSAFQAFARAIVPLAVTVARVALVVGGGLAAVHYGGASAETVFSIFAAANVVSCLVLMALFRRAVR